MIVTDNDIGKWVIYKKDTPEEDRGIITRYNDSFVFVKYKHGIQATRAEDLSLKEDE